MHLTLKCTKFKKKTKKKTRFLQVLQIPMGKNNHLWTLLQQYNKVHF